jgi:HEAT repeat protein
MRIRKQISDTPKSDRDNSLKVEVKPHPFGFKKSPDNPLNERIVEAINMMGGVGNDAEANYQAALDALRKQSSKVVPIVAAEYADLPKDQYLDRWSLIQLLAELKAASSLPILDGILSSRIPPEQSKNPHSFTTVGEEITIRTTAVEAVTRIAADKNKQALEILLKHAQHKNFSVQRASIQGYLTYGGKDAREVLVKVLPKKDQFILDIRRVDIREVPQAEGGIFLVSRDSDELPPPQLPDRSKVKRLQNQ